MKEFEEKWTRQYKQESDEVLFGKLEFDAKLKERVRQGVQASQSPAPSKRRSLLGRSKWAYGAAAAVVLLAIAISAPGLRDIAGPSGPAVIEEPGLVAEVPGNNGSSSTIPDGAGSGLTQLKTVTVPTLEEAKQYFGADLLAPSLVPDSFSLARIEATGMEEQVKTQVVFFYQSADGEFTYAADRKEAVIPLEFFQPIEVNGADGYVFAQPNLTELYWLQDGIQYSIVGALTEEEALAVAASLQ